MRVMCVRVRRKERERREVGGGGGGCARENTKGLCPFVFF
jgi:hypothetical protein